MRAGRIATPATAGEIVRLSLNPHRTGTGGDLNFEAGGDIGEKFVIIGLHYVRYMYTLPDSTKGSPYFHHRGHKGSQRKRKGEKTMTLNELSGIVVDAAMKVHTALGPGLLESAYQACLQYELQKRGLEVRAQVEMPIWYDGVCIEVGYRIDLLVVGQLVLELKSVDKLLPIHQAQLLSYLKLGNFKLGLLLNFNVEHMKEGIVRLIN